MKKFQPLFCLFIIAALASCDTGTTSSPKVCECPNGTIHEVGPCGCDGVDCACKWLNYGIRLEDSTNGALTGNYVDNINTALQDYVSSYSSESAIRQKNIKIVIVPGDSSSRDNDVITIGIDKCVDSGTVLGEIAPYLVQIMAKVLNANIRLANGRTLNAAELAKLGKQFDSAKEIVRLSHAVFQYQRQA